MITENLSTLKIHKLTQTQYDRELEAGNVDENALYLTPEEEIDLSPYATIEQLNSKSDIRHTHNVGDVTGAISRTLVWENPSCLISTGERTAFEPTIISGIPNNINETNAYGGVEVVYYNTRSVGTAPLVQSTGFVPFMSEGLFVLEWNDGKQIYQRIIMFAGDELEISKCLSVSNTGEYSIYEDGVEDNSQCIPYRIYAINSVT